MRNIDRLFSEYGESHQNETNKTIHWICVPSIFFSLTGLLYCIKIPFQVGNYSLNLAVLVIIFTVIYYISLSPSLSIGMLVFCVACLYIAHLIETAGHIKLWIPCTIIFILAWLGQFYGHKVEGKKPSFLKDLQFLLIGPAWLMGFVYKKMGVQL